jgi:DNA invertase Pin-like site-specific DNA recombinase
MRIGYSYLRYSSTAQADGDSIRRQTALAAAWCKRNGVKLDTSTTYEDHGRSAYRGQHRQTGALAQFLAEVESARIPKGSVLILENLDRLSRENPWDALPLLCGLVNAGITVATLSPSEMIYERGRDLTGLMLAVVEFGRGHSESKSKAGRMGEVWDEKKRLAREGKDQLPRKKDGRVTKALTGRLPAWVKDRDGKLVPVPGRVALVKRIFKLAIEGNGLSLIVKKLTADRVETWGRGGAWSKAYVHRIIAKRTVCGEYQPIKDGKPDGDPLPSYYPRVVDEGTWDRAQAALAARREKPGRIGHKVASLFGGLLWDATTSTRMLIAHQTRGSGKARCRARVLVNAASLEGRAKSVSFPNDVFESAVLSLLKEIRPADVTGEEPAGQAVTLAGELAAVNQRIQAIETELTGDAGDIPALIRTAKALDAKRLDLTRRLAEARQRESNPKSAAWAEAKTPLTVAKDETGRLRLRALLRIMVERIDVLIVVRGATRLAAVQMRFNGGGRRNYIIRSTAAGNGRKGSWAAESFSDTKTAGLDLGNPDDAALLAGFLEKMNLSPSE